MDDVTHHLKYLRLTVNGNHTLTVIEQSFLTDYLCEGLLSTHKIKLSHEKTFVLTYYPSLEQHS